MNFFWIMPGNFNQRSGHKLCVSKIAPHLFTPEHKHHLSVASDLLKYAKQTKISLKTM
jgi:hypothetical protein